MRQSWFLFPFVEHAIHECVTPIAEHASGDQCLAQLLMELQLERWLTQVICIDNRKAFIVNVILN